MFSLSFQNPYYFQVTYVKCSIEMNLLKPNIFHILYNRNICTYRYIHENLITFETFESRINQSKK